MKVLIIAHDIGSKEMGMLFRPYYIAQGLKEKGLTVEVITASYSSVRRINPTISYNLECHNIDGILYHWIKSIPFKGNSIQRAIGMIWFSFKLWWFAEYFKNKIKPDAVIASSPHPFVIWGAHRIAQKSKADLYFEVRDIWPLTMHELSGMNPKHPFYVICQWAEDFAYRKSKKVISLLPYAYEHMKTRGLAKEKFVFIPNGFDENDIKNKQPLNKTMLKTIINFKKQYPFVVGYTGAHGLANSLTTLIDALNLLKNNNRIGLILIGSGSERNRLIEKTKLLNLKNILFLEPVSKQQVMSVLEHFDIAYIGLKKSDLFKFGVSPNKLIDYMALAKPVIYAIDSERDPVQESGCGFKVESDNPENLAITIEKMSKMEPLFLHELGQKGYRWVKANISYDVLIEKMLNTLNSQ